MSRKPISSRSAKGAKSKKKSKASKAPAGAPLVRPRFVQAVSSAPFQVFASILVVAIPSTWLMAREPLMRSIGATYPDQPAVAFSWPERADESGETWLPRPVQRLLTDIALSNLSSDPFDQPGLQLAADALSATGWFSTLDRVQRLAGNTVEIEGDWRVPVAVVRHRTSDYLVATGGEILQLPPNAPVAEGTMPLILSPTAAPPTEGPAIRFGVAWAGGDVQAAIELFGRLRRDPEFARVAAIDLAPYARSGHLTLITDQGSRIVWGSPIGAASNGEVSTEKKLANLRDILSQRLDARHDRIEIYPPVVLIDKTVPN